MAEWREGLFRLAGGLRDRVLDGADRVADRLSGDPHPAVVPYRGYGTATRVLVLGRVLRGAPLPPAAAGDAVWRNALSTYRRIAADPVPRARVAARVGGALVEVEADDEGFLRRWVDVPAPVAAGWVPVDLELLAPGPGADAPPAELAGRRGTTAAVVPAAAAAFGVISDLDDTVIQSHVTDFLRAARTVLLGNARTRLPFPGVAAFYRALSRGAAGPAGPANPIFYVSSSPWNLHDMIADFMAVQRIPDGPLLLRDWDVNRALLGGARHHGHKGALVREIMEAYPALPFILVGDSGEQDPEIYRRVVHDFPGRVLAVYIRNVTPGTERAAAVAALAAEVTAAGSALVLADDTLAAARHAAERGWIDAGALAAVAADRREDEAAPNE